MGTPPSPRPRLHVVTVGTSILVNARRAMPSLPGPGEDRRVAEETPSLRAELAALVARAPYDASAELAALRPFLERDEVQAVHLVVTETAAGQLCGGILERWLQQRGIRELSRKTIPAYYRREDADDVPAEGADERAERFVQGLIELRDALLDFIRRRQAEGRYEVLLNATGGFKPEMAVAAQVAAATTTPVYYMHEHFHASVFLPPFFLDLARSRALGEALARFGPDRRLTGDPARALYRGMQRAGLWDDAERLRLVRALFGEGDALPYGLELTPYGRYLATQAAGSGVEHGAP